MFTGQFARYPRRAFSALALLLAAGVFTSAQADSALEPCADAQALQSALQRLNEVRLLGDAPCAAGKGAVQSLAWESRLAGSAQAQATDLALRDLLSHLDARQRGLGARLREAGYAASSAGENLAAGQTDFDDTLQAWLASPTHCANLMQPDFRDLGLACVQRPGSRYERFWVAHLGAPVRGGSRNAEAPLNAAVVAAR